MRPYRSQPETPFDLGRHLGEMRRFFFPILALVLAAGVVAWALWFPGSDTYRADPDFAPPRVGLLPVERAGGEGEALPFDPAFVPPRPLELARAPRSARFDAPMGSPLGALTYNAQPFMTTRHLGDDLNGIGGWDSDLGDPVYAIGDGEIIYSGWASDGWGNVITILHRLPDGGAVTSYYGHLDTLGLPAGVPVRRGDRIGTVGKADGRYLAHLHFEIRPPASLDPGAGYGDQALGRQSGELFLLKNRGAPEDRQNPALGPAYETDPRRGVRQPPGERGLKIQTEGADPAR